MQPVRLFRDGLTRAVAPQTSVFAVAAADPSRFAKTPPQLFIIIIIYTFTFAFTFIYIFLNPCATS